MRRRRPAESYKHSWCSEDDCTLTPREREILWLVAQGRRNHDIGKYLRISICTVKLHLAHIFLKLGVNRRHEAVTIARQQGQLPS